jgi:hypothetical protein
MTSIVAPNTGAGYGGALLVLGEHDSALEIFNHSFAHAAARGLEFPTRRREPEMFRDAA